MRRILAALISGLLAVSAPARAGDECVTNNDCPASRDFEAALPAPEEPDLLAPEEAVTQVSAAPV